MATHSDAFVYEGSNPSRHRHRLHKPAMRDERQEREKLGVKGTRWVELKIRIVDYEFLW